MGFVTPQKINCDTVIVIINQLSWLKTNVLYGDNSYNPVTDDSCDN